jgi:hypothetical protein
LPARKRASSHSVNKTKRKICENLFSLGNGGLLRLSFSHSSLCVRPSALFN